MVVYGLVMANTRGGSHAGRLMLDIFPEMVIVLGTLVPSLVLRLKHRSQAPEGSLLPLFLLFLSLQATNMVPTIGWAVGINYFSVSWLTRIERFIMLSTYVILLYASIQNMKNVNTTKQGAYVGLSLAACFVIASIIPSSSVQGAWSRHDAVFWMMVFLVAAAAVLTYLMAFVNDKESYHLNRFLTFLFITAGDLAIMASGSLSARIAGTSLFAIGVVMLCVVSPKGY